VVERRKCNCWSRAKHRIGGDKKTTSCAFERDRPILDWRLAVRRQAKASPLSAYRATIRRRMKNGRLELLARASSPLSAPPPRKTRFRSPVGFWGLLGSWMGALHLNPKTLRLLLAFLLLAAAGRMIAASKFATMIQCASRELGGNVMSNPAGDYSFAGLGFTGAQGRVAPRFGKACGHAWRPTWRSRHVDEWRVQPGDPLGDEFAFDSRRERLQIGLRRAILRGRESEEGRIKANEGTDRKEEGHREDG
jgi:hypothetical protein